MLKIAKACCIVAVAASATLSAIAESTAAKSKIDLKSAEIVQRMKAMCLPEVSFKPPATLVDAIEFFRVASKDYDSPKIQKEMRGFSFMLRVDGSGEAPEIPMIKAKNISFYDALKLVCESIGYTFVVDGSFVSVMPKGDAARKAVQAHPEDFGSKPKPEEFKVRLTAVAVADAEKEELKTKKFSPETRVIVTPGNIAVFDLEYDFPTNVKSRLFLGPNFKKSQLDENPFGTSGSGLHSGKGNTSRVILLGAGGNEPYDQSLLLRSVRVEGEIEAEKGARRNNSFFICDAPVNLLFANKGEESGKGAKTLEPSASPKPDPTLGVVAQEESNVGVSKSSTPRGFMDNLDEALAKAKAEGRLVFACFSGSDWCGWCMKLEREVLSRPEFLAGVKNDFVLVYIDSPENKGVLSDHAKAANPKLVKKYGIRGFPTALILDGDGKQVGETGYRKGGPVEYAKHLMSMRRGISLSGNFPATH